MTKNSDEMAFEEIFGEEHTVSFYEEKLEGFKVGIAHERKRSEKFIKAVEEVIFEPDDVPCYHVQLIEQALKDYKDGK